MAVTADQITRLNEALMRAGFQKWFIDDPKDACDFIGIVISDADVDRIKASIEEAKKEFAAHNKGSPLGAKGWVYEEDDGEVRKKPKPGTT